MLTYAVALLAWYQKLVNKYVTKQRQCTFKKAVKLLTSSLFEHKMLPQSIAYMMVDWAGFEPATSRLRSEHYYP
jgi:hypothetical protein